MNRRIVGKRSIKRALALLVFALAACGDKDARARSEARMFLSLYEATDHRAPVSERERKIAQLNELALSDETVQKTRDECVEAHRALIRAERENESAAKQLDQALAAQPDGEPLPVTATEGIRNGIAAAEAALSDARKRFEQCESDARGLALRFGPR